LLPELELLFFELEDEQEVDTAELEDDGLLNCDSCAWTVMCMEAYVMPGTEFSARSASGRFGSASLGIK
jgi:hypothetical protein